MNLLVGFIKLVSSVKGKSKSVLNIDYKTNWQVSLRIISILTILYYNPSRDMYECSLYHVRTKVHIIKTYSAEWK